jgi:hypothetical protein
MSNLKDKLLKFLQSEADGQNQSLEELISGLTLTVPGSGALSPGSSFKQVDEGLFFDQYEEVLVHLFCKLERLILSNGFVPNAA